MDFECGPYAEVRNGHVHRGQATSVGAGAGVGEAGKHVGQQEHSMNFECRPLAEVKNAHVARGHRGRASAGAVQALVRQGTASTATLPTRVVARGRDLSFARRSANVRPPNNRKKRCRLRVAN